MFLDPDKLCWLDKDVAFAYNFFWRELEFFLKYLEISLTSLGVLARIEGGTGKTKVGFTVTFSLVLVFKFLKIRGVNLELT